MHRIMRPTFTYVTSSVVCPSPYTLSTLVSPAKTVGPIEMTFRLVGTNKCVKWGANVRQLANTIEPCVLGSDAALCHITLTSFFVTNLRQKIISVRRKEGHTLCSVCSVCSCRMRNKTM